jgi:hypothetical protein
VPIANYQSPTIDYQQMIEVINVLQTGVAGEEHQAFAQNLAGRE